MCIISSVKFEEDIMSTEMVRLNIILPSSIAEEPNQIAEPRKRSQFVAKAVRFRIRQLKEKKLEALFCEEISGGKRGRVKNIKKIRIH